MQKCETLDNPLCSKHTYITVTTYTRTHVPPSSVIAYAETEFLEIVVFPSTLLYHRYIWEQQHTEMKTACFSWLFISAGLNPIALVCSFTTLTQVLNRLLCCLCPTNSTNSCCHMIYHFIEF